MEWSADLITSTFGKLKSKRQTAKAEWLGCGEHREMHPAEASRQQSYPLESSSQEAKTCWELKCGVREANKMIKVNRSTETAVWVEKI